MIRTLRDWTCSLVFAVVFGLSMVLWDVALRVSCLFGNRAQSYVAGALQIWLLWTLRICNIRLLVDRSPLVKPHTSYIIVANHQSMFDMPIYGSLFFSNFPKYIAKVELSKWLPSVSFHLRHGGHAIIDRKDRESAVKAIDKLGYEVIEHGFSAVIFPEGTRARKGVLNRFKPAGMVALLQQARHTPIVPVCVEGSWRLMDKNMLPLPYGLVLRAWIGDPIERRDDEDPYELVARVERQINEAMARIRGAEPATACAPANGVDANGTASSASASARAVDEARSPGPSA